MAEQKISVLLYLQTPELLSKVPPALQKAFPQLSLYRITRHPTLQPILIRENFQAIVLEVDTQGNPDPTSLQTIIRYAPECPVFLITNSDPATHAAGTAAPEGALVFGPLASRELPKQIKRWLTQKAGPATQATPQAGAHYKRIAEALAESRRNLSATMRNLPGMAYRCRNDPQWTMEFVSEGCRELTGYPPEALLYNELISYADLIHPEDRQQVWQNVQLALNEKRHFHLIYRIIHASGDVHWVWEQGCGIHTTGGELLAIEGLMLDFTAQQQAEQQIRLQAMALMASDLGISISDQQNIVTWINPAFTRLTGYTAQDIIGSSIEILRSGIHPESLYRELNVSVRAGHVWHGELINQRKDGSLYHEEQTITPVSNAKGEISHFIAVRQDITERKKALQALQESEERYRILFDQAHDSFLVVDDQDRIVEANQRTCDMLGYTRDELRTLLISDIQAPECRGVRGAVIQGEIARYGEQSFETTDLRKDGTRVPVEVTNTRVIYQGRSLTLSVVRDISERKRSEELLRQEKERLELLHRLSMHLSSSLDMHSVAQMALQDLCAIFGAQEGLVFLPDAPTPKNLDIIAGTQWDLETLRKNNLQMQMEIGLGLAGWVAQHREAALVADVTQDPRWHTFPGLDEWVRGAMSVPLMGGETLVGVLSLYSSQPDFFNEDHLYLAESAAAPIAVAINNARLFKALSNYSKQLEQRVTERTSELQAQYARLDAVLQSISDGVIVTDAQGAILQLNPVAQSWLSQRLTPEDAERLKQAVTKLARSALQRPEIVLELQDVDLELRAAPILEFMIPPRAEGQPQASVVVAVHDISHLKMLDRLKSRFVSNVSHELRTPVTTIGAYIQLLRRGAPEKIPEYLDALETEVKRQTRLIDDILQFSRIDAGRLDLHYQQMNLNMLVELTVEGFQALAAEKEVILHYTPDTQPLVARIDQTRIQQVLNNLINNALQYTPTGGQVWVTLSQAYIKNRHAAVIQVQDTGVGISEEDLPHIFERFYRGRIPQDLQIPGTGLGLAIVKEIIQQHGGWVDVESTVGHGSWFTIYLPLDPGAP